MNQQQSRRSSGVGKITVEKVAPGRRRRRWLLVVPVLAGGALAVQAFVPGADVVSTQAAVVSVAPEDLAAPDKLDERVAYVPVVAGRDVALSPPVPLGAVEKQATELIRRGADPAQNSSVVVMPDGLPAFRAYDMTRESEHFGALADKKTYSELGDEKLADRLVASTRSVTDRVAVASVPVSLAEPILSTLLEVDGIPAHLEVYLADTKDPLNVFGILHPSQERLAVGDGRQAAVARSDAWARLAIHDPSWHGTVIVLSASSKVSPESLAKFAETFDLRSA